MCGSQDLKLVWKQATQLPSRAIFSMNCSAGEAGSHCAPHRSNLQWLWLYDCMDPELWSQETNCLPCSGIWRSDLQNMQGRGAAYTQTWVPKQKVTYNMVRSQLCKLNLSCGFIHPSKLTLTFQNSTQTFSTAKEAQDFEKHIKPNMQGDKPTKNNSQVLQRTKSM